MTDKRLGTEPLGHLFWSMAIPVILQQSLLLLNSIMDCMWIAHIPEVGQQAFTAFGICVPIVYIIMGLAELVGTGVAPKVGFILGQGRRYRAEQTLGAMFVFNILLALLACGVIELLCGPIVTLFGGRNETAVFSELYLRISTPGNALCIVSGGLAPFLLAQGRSNEAGLVLGSGVVLNMVLDPLLIFGLNMGLAGAAWATTIAEAVAAILAVACLRRPGDIRLRRIHMRLNWRLITPCLAIGVTPMSMILAETIQMGFYNRVLGSMVGDVGIGTMALVIRLHDFLYFPVYGMSFGVQSITSYNLGAKLCDRVRKNVRLLMNATLIWSIIIWLVMMFFTKPIVQMVIGSGSMTDYAVPMVRLSFTAFFMATLQFAGQSTLQAMNKPVLTFWLEMAHILLLLIPLVWILPMIFTNYPDACVFLSQPITDVIIFVITGTYIYKLLKKLPSYE